MLKLNLTNFLRLRQLVVDSRSSLVCRCTQLICFFSRLSCSVSSLSLYYLHPFLHSSMVQNVRSVFLLFGPFFLPFSGRYFLALYLWSVWVLGHSSSVEMSHLVRWKYWSLFPKHWIAVLSVHCLSVVASYLTLSSSF